MLYSEKVMDHFRNPRNLGKMDDADGIGEVGNAKCGDIMKMYIKVKDGIMVRQQIRMRIRFPQTILNILLQLHTIFQYTVSRYSPDPYAPQLRH